MKLISHRSLSCSRRSRSFSACSAWAFSAFSRSSFSRAARRNCSKLSLDDLTADSGVDVDFCARLAHEPMFFSLTSWWRQRGARLYMIVTRIAGVDLGPNGAASVPSRGFRPHARPLCLFRHNSLCLEVIDYCDLTGQLWFCLVEGLVTHCHNGVSPAWWADVTRHCLM